MAMRKVFFLLVGLLTCSAFAQDVVTNESVLKMVKAGLGDEVIVGMINQNAARFVLTADELIKLKESGVSDKVISAMVAKGTSSASVKVEAPKASDLLVLQDGTSLKLRLNRNLSSADAKVGENVDFEVLEDITVSEILVIAKGSTAMATVTQAQSKRRMARGGKLDVNIDYARLVTGEKVALRAVKETKGGGHTGAMTGGIVATSIIFFPAAPLFLFMHGKDITIPKGTEITAYVNGDNKIDRQKLTAKLPSRPPEAATPSQSPESVSKRP